MSKVSFVQADDWEAIYINGILHCQDHSTLQSNYQRQEFFAKLGIEVEFIDAQDQADDIGEFPSNLTDVKPDGAL